MDQQNHVDDAPFDAAHVIGRGAVLGTLIAFAITFVAAMIAGVEPLEAAGIAALPALFAGPLVAGLLIMANYESYLRRHGGH